jgi:hypothetical protein
MIRHASGSPPSQGSRTILSPIINGDNVKSGVTEKMIDLGPEKGGLLSAALQAAPFDDDRMCGRERTHMNSIFSAHQCRLQAGRQVCS